MESIDTRTWIVIGIVVLLLLAGLAALLVRQKQQSQRLAQRFGPEYARTVDTLGGRGKAETELKAREQRVDQLSILPLAPAEAERFTQAWAALQARFIDNPKAVLAQAEQLVRELLLKRGYPMGDFERRAADISVDHPGVVANYRAAQTIAARAHRGEADTEDMRRAVVHFRALFDELLEVRPVDPLPVPAV